MVAEASFDIAELWEALRFGAGPAAFAVLYGLFARLEDIASPDAKRDIAAWLKRAEVPGSLVNWPSQFVVLFDRVFGERHLSWRCFYRSCVASLAATMVTVAAWTILRPDDVAHFVDAWVRAFPVMLLLLPVTAMALNCLPDYASLLQSRLVIRWMISSRSMGELALLLVLDFASSITIFVLARYLFSLVPTLFYESASKSPYLIGRLIAKVIYWFGSYATIIRSDLWNMWFIQHSLTRELSLPPPAIFLYTSLFTSIWVWLYALSAGAIRLALTLQPVLGWLKWFLDIDGKPIRSIGFVVGLIGAALWWGLVLIAGPEG